MAVVQSEQIEGTSHELADVKGRKQRAVEAFEIIYLSDFRFR